VQVHELMQVPFWQNWPAGQLTPAHGFGKQVPFEQD
jgi:hypothetical protein